MKPAAPLCRPCIDERMRWLDSKPSQMFHDFGIVYGSGAAHDVSPAGLRDRSRVRYDRWRDLVRFQMAHIAATCRAQGHGRSGADSASRDVGRLIMAHAGSQVAA